MTMLVLCHCVLNVNSRAPGIARWKGIIKPLWDIMRAKNIQFIQIPCPEAAYLGLRRWWFVKEQYDNALYKDLCKKIAVGICEILMENGIRKFKFIGLGLSPSCGYRETQSDPSWGGRPREVDVKHNVVMGPGVLIEIIDKVFSKYEFDYEIYDLPPSIIYPGERTGIQRYPTSFEESLKELSELLGFDYRSLPLHEYPKSLDADMRSRKILIVPSEIVVKRSKVIEKYVNEGYGLMLIPKSSVLTPEKEGIADIFAKQVENHLDVGHEVTLYMCEECSNLFKKFIEILETRNLLESIHRVSM